MIKYAKRVTAAALSAAGYVATAGACFASAEEQQPGFAADTGSTAWMLMRIVLFLIIIIGIFLLIMRVVAQKNRMFQSGRSIKSIGGLGLGQNKSVQVVQIGRSLYVLGVGNDVELVSKIDDPEEIQYIFDHLHTAGSGDFKGFPTVGEWFKKLIGKERHSEDLDVTPSFQAVFQEKMQRIASRQKKVDELMGQEQESYNERLNDKS